MNAGGDRREWMDRCLRRFGAWLDRLPEPDVQPHVDADIRFLVRLSRNTFAETARVTRPARQLLASRWDARVRPRARAALSRVDTAIRQALVLLPPVAARGEAVAKGVLARMRPTAARLEVIAREARATLRPVAKRCVVAAREVLARLWPMVKRCAVEALMRLRPVAAGRFKQAVGWVRARANMKRWWKVSAAAALALAVALGIGLAAGHLQRGKRMAVKAASTATPSTTPPAWQPAAVEKELAPKAIPLALLNPITGPGRPPLPEDAQGPSGSRRTTGTQEVALTFDDGPDPRFTPEVLALLRQYHVKATFCLIGVNVVEFPQLVRQIVAEGHTLCNHSWIHDLNLGNRGKAAILADLTRTNDAIHAAAPYARISYYRQPGGMWTQTVVESARQLGMTSLHWGVDPKDWLKPGPRTIATTITSGTLPGSIVLMHDGGGDRRGTVEALRTIMPNLTARFSLVALPPGVDQPRLYGLDRPVHIGQK